MRMPPWVDHRVRAPNRGEAVGAWEKQIVIGTPRYFGRMSERAAAAVHQLGRGLVPWSE